MERNPVDPSAASHIADIPVIGLVFRHFWIVFIVFTLVHLRRSWTRIRAKISETPELEPGYRALYYGLGVVLNVPWVLMGLGILSGRVAIVHEYLSPSAGNPVVLAWWGAMGLLALGTTVWLFAGGAEQLSAHPGFFPIPLGSATRVKQVWVVALVWNVGMGALIFSGFPSAKSEWPNWLPAAAPSPQSLFPLVFLVGFPAISFVIAHTGGWGALAERYRYDGPIDQKRYMRSGSFGAMRYKNMLTVAGDDSGLYLAVFLPFRVGHPPMRIPWVDIRGSVLAEYGVSLVRLEITGDPPVVIALRAADLRGLFEGRPLPEQLRFLG